MSLSLEGKKPTINELNSLYQQAEEADQEIFAEQRSNILLVAGDHYTKKGSKFWNRIRDYKQLSSEQKLRLTKNHIQKITKNYINNITTYAPGVIVAPNNKDELQDQKAAELSNSVWAYAKQRYKLRAKIKNFAKDFIDIGEVATKIFYDPNIGDFLGYEAEVDEQGNPILDENGQYVASKKAKFSGDFVFERIFGMDLLRDPAAKSWEESKVIIYRRMANIHEMKKMVGNDQEKLKYITSNSEQTYMVFDASTGAYKKSENEVLIREYYYRPCMEYPQGYYFITTQAGILFEGELPFGIFPIVVQTFDEVQTSPRGRSIIKQLRPYQAEINRSASKIAEHQVTLGDDKIFIQNGTKVGQNQILPGVRTYSYTGMQPVIMEGRDGSQYLNYMQSQVDEIYMAANMVEDSEEKQGQLDPYALLFRSMRDKKRFSFYAEKFEDFLVAVCHTFLELAKQYYDENTLIPMIGRSEAVNISEFKNQSPLSYSIKLEPQTEDIESRMGKQLMLNHVLQYVGNNLEKEDIGKIIKEMPYAEAGSSFSDLTIDYDNATNDILALDRGEFPQINQYDNHVYIIKRLTTRMKQSDFKTLAPEIQQNYQAFVQYHEQMEAQNQAQIQAAKSEYIPANGPLVGIDFYVQDPMDASKTRRARVPYQAVDWLIKKLESQGMGLAVLDKLGSGALSEMSAMLPNGQANPESTYNGYTSSTSNGSTSSTSGFDPYSGTGYAVQ